MTDWLNKTHVGDCRDLLRQMAADGVRVQTCVSSPPYFGLRSYMPDGVRLKAGLPDEVRATVIAELQQLGIFPLTRTSE